MNLLEYASCMAQARRPVTLVYDPTYWFLVEGTQTYSNMRDRTIRRAMT